ncbi:MAG: glycerol-3-phosphate 1-O-acyltransferase PlsY [Hyphomicrobiaceae bacterium]
MGILMIALIASFVFGYVLGSIPFGLILTRLAGLGDVRSIGSGNIGATNVLRTGNKKLAAATLLFDVLKGTAAVVVAQLVANILLTGQTAAIPDAHGEGAVLTAWPGLAAGLGAFLGHLFPIWLGFKGGKGVATYIGVLLGAAWKIALVFCTIWLVLAITTRYSSLSALVAAVVTPLAAWLLDSPNLAIITIIMSAFLLIKHTANIRRLVAGQEPKIGGK